MSFTKEDAKIILQDLLNKEFTKIAEKRRIVTREKEYAIACPCCGDSNKNMSKKRGTLYFNSFRYRCFNCGEKTTLLGLLKRFEIHIDPHQKLQIVEYVQEASQRVQFSEDEFVTKNLDKLIDLEELSIWFNTNPNSIIKNFKPVTNGSKVWKYLVDRKIFNFDNLYEGIYHYTTKWSEPVLINLNHSRGKVLGIQTRNLKSDRNLRKYRIFPFSELWEMLYPDKELDEIECIGYNRLSYLYNILNIDWSSPITIFEGALDTKFFPNSIGCVGTNTDINFILNQDVDIRFFYDYDNTGIKKSKELLEQGYPVFLWEKVFDFWSSKTKNPSKAGRELRDKIVDLNDIAKIINNPYSKLELEKMFSLDKMDLIYIRN
jgi:transposase-like protein